MDIPTMNDIEQAARGNRILAIWLQAKDNLSDDQFYRAAIIALVGQVEALKLQAEKVDLATSKERNALEQKLARALEGVRKYLQTGAWDHLMDLLPEEKGWRER